MGIMQTVVISKESFMIQERLQIVRLDLLMLNKLFCVF